MPTPATTLKLRSDLLFSQQVTGEKSIFVIKDPASGRFFQFGELEHFIAHQLDGQTSPAELRQRVGEKFGSAISMETLERFIERLRGLGLLTDARTTAS